MSHKEDSDDDRYESKQGESKDDFVRSESKSEEKEESKNKINLVEKVQEFIFMDEDLAKKFENFIERRSNIVDLESDEYKLEYTEVYQEYKQLFEESVEGHIVNDLHSTIHDFYAELKASLEKDENSNESIFAQILIAMTDFDIFMTMMKEAAHGAGNKASHK